ncbi:MAG: DNA-binding protein [Deltaproteobacteria bacterium]|nr:DNA-binding protein [Deltaproteobacteria bacterium]
MQNTHDAPPCDRRVNLLRADEVAEILKMQPGTVYTLARRGALPFVRIGRTIRFDADEVRRLLKGLPPAAAIEQAGAKVSR